MCLARNTPTDINEQKLLAVQRRRRHRKTRTMRGPSLDWGPKPSQEPQHSTARAEAPLRSPLESEKQRNHLYQRILAHAEKHARSYTKKASWRSQYWRENRLWPEIARVSWNYATRFYRGLQPCSSTWQGATWANKVEALSLAGALAAEAAVNLDVPVAMAARVVQEETAAHLWDAVVAWGDAVPTDFDVPTAVKRVVQMMKEEGLELGSVQPLRFVPAPKWAEVERDEHGEPLLSVVCQSVKRGVAIPPESDSQKLKRILGAMRETSAQTRMETFAEIEAQRLQREKELAEANVSLVERFLSIFA
jgi:hypothetical protein